MNLQTKFTNSGTTESKIQCVILKFTEVKY
jgi:hypothetical protein